MSKLSMFESITRGSKTSMRERASLKEASDYSFLDKINNLIEKAKKELPEVLDWYKKVVNPKAKIYSVELEQDDNDNFNLTFYIGSNDEDDYKELPVSNYKQFKDKMKNDSLWKNKVDMHDGMSIRFEVSL